MAGDNHRTGHGAGSSAGQCGEEGGGFAAAPNSRAQREFAASVANSRLGQAMSMNADQLLAGA